MRRMHDDGDHLLRFDQKQPKESWVVHLEIPIGRLGIGNLVIERISLVTDKSWHGR